MTLEFVESGDGEGELTPSLPALVTRNEMTGPHIQGDTQ